MKKVFIMASGGCVCLIMIILGISFLSSDGEVPKETSAKNRIVSMVQENYGSLKKVTRRLRECDIEGRFYLADKADLEVNEELAYGKLYVDSSTENDNSIPEALVDNTIKNILKTDEIDEIYKGKNWIDFVGNSELCKDQNGGFVDFIIH